MKVITSTDIHADVVRLVEDARHFLLLISPYVDPWDRLVTEVKAASLREGMRVMVLVRGGEDADRQTERARALLFPQVQLEQLNRLHAKIYMSESEIIVTSMNLLKSSALDSWEIALRFSKDEDARQYGEISGQALNLWRRALEERAGEEKLRRGGRSGAAPQSPPKQSPGNKPRPAPQPAASPPPAGQATVIQTLGRLAASFAAATAAPPPKNAAPQGACIRCGGPIPRDPDRPLCASCYRAWSRYENPRYEETFCHGCGKLAKTTFARPLCRPCFTRS